MAANRHRRAGRQARPSRCGGRCLRHRLCRAGPDLAAVAAAADNSKRRRRGGRAAVGDIARSRPGARGGDGQDSGRYRVHPDRARRDAAADGEGRVRLCRQRPARPCRKLRWSNRQSADYRSGCRRRRVPQPVSRLGPCRPPGSAGLEIPRRAVSLARRRGASHRVRRQELCRPCGRRQRRKEPWRKHRVDRDPDRTVDGADRCRRPGVASLRAAPARPDGRRRRPFGRESRSGAPQGQYRSDRHLGRRRDQRSAGDADRPGRARGRNPRPAARRDPARVVPQPARLGGGRRNPVLAPGRH